MTGRADLVEALRGIRRAPRRSASVAATCTVALSMVVIQMLVDAGLRQSIAGTFAEPSQRTVVLAISDPNSQAADPAVLAEVGARVRAVGGVVRAGAMVRFLDTAAGPSGSASAQVGWAEFGDLAVVAPDGGWTQISSGRSALVPNAVRDKIGGHRGRSIVIAGRSMLDGGRPPGSLMDPQLRNVALVPFGLAGSKASFRDALVGVAVLLDRVPSDSDIRRLRVALSPERPRDAVVVSSGSVPASVGAVVSLAGAGGRSLAAGAALGGACVIAALQAAAIVRRRGEAAVRMALGATAGDVRRWLLLEAAVLGAMGGVLAALVGGGVVVLLLASGVPIAPLSPAWWPLIVASGSVVSVAASLIPVWLATRQDPADVLRTLGEG